MMKTPKKENNPKTVFVNLNNEEFEKLLNVDKGDRVIFCDERNQCITSYHFYEEIAG